MKHGREEDETIQLDSKVARTDETQPDHPHNNSTNQFLSLGNALEADGITMHEFLGYLSLSKEDHRPVQKIISKGGINTIKFLLSHDSMGLHQDFIEDPQDNSLYPLDHALSEGQEDIALFIINAGADIENEATDTDIQPVSAAARKGLLEMVRILHEKGAHIKANDTRDSEIDEGIQKLFPNFTDTPLYHATVKGHIAVVKYLLSVGVETFSEENVRRDEANVHPGIIYTDPAYMLDVAIENHNDELIKIYKQCQLVDDLYTNNKVEVTAENFELYSDLASNPDLKETYLRRIESFFKDNKYNNHSELQHKLMNFENNLKLVLEDASIDLSSLKSDKLKTLSHEGGVMKLFNLAAYTIYREKLLTLEEVSKMANEDVAVKFKDLFNFVSVQGMDVEIPEIGSSGESDLGSNNEMD